MRTLLLCSRDDALVQRIAKACGPDGRITRLRRDADVPRVARAARFDAVVFDVRSVPRNELDPTIAALRASLPDSTAIIAVGSLARHGLEVLTRAGERDLDVVLDDRDSVAELILAMAWDDSRTVAAATVLDVLRKTLKPHAARLARDVLTSGCRVSTVKEAARRHRASEDTLGHWLASEGSPAPRLAVRLAKCLYALVLLRCYGAPWGALAAWTRYQKPSTLRSRMHALFGDDLLAHEWRQRDATPEALLRAFVQDWLEVHSGEPLHRTLPHKQASKQWGPTTAEE